MLVPDDGKYNMNTMVGITCFIFAATPFSFPTITLAPSETKLLQLAISKNHSLIVYV
jgi:hypothetical protein